MPIDAEFVDAIAKLERAARPVNEVHRQRATVQKLVDGPDGNRTLLEFPIDLPVTDETVTDVSDFCVLTNERSPKSNPLIVIGRAGHALAKTNALTHDEGKIALRLDSSKEHQCLMALMKGVQQKTLWRILITDLYGHIDSALLLAISKLKLKGVKEENVEIALSGIGTGQKRDAFDVSFDTPKGSQSMEIALDWDWNGKIWRGFQREYAVNLRLELSVDDAGKLVFTFHPRNIEEVMDAALADLKQEIQGLCSSATVIRSV